MTYKRIVLSVIGIVMVIGAGFVVFIFDQMENSYYPHPRIQIGPHLIIFDQIYTSYSGSSFSGSAQHYDISIEKSIEVVDVIAVATVEKAEIELFPFQDTFTHDNGTKYLGIDYLEPYQKITLAVDYYLKDTTGKFSDTLIFYDLKANAIGEQNGVRVLYSRNNVETYNIGDKHFYTLEIVPEKSNGLFADGFYSRFNFDTDLYGNITIHSGKNELFGHQPLNYADVKEKTLTIGAQDMTLEMIETRDKLLVQAGQ